MQTYREFSPTGFDPRGLSLPERQDWIVVPVGRNRDSGPAAESNFSTALEILGGESETVEVHRFGHWGCGWFAIILTHPDRTEIVREIEAALADYPLLNDSDFFEREYQAASDSWRTTSLEERIRICAKYRASIFAARRDEIPSVDHTSDLIAYLAGES